jgi:putative alpha-1,2-mannosidase
MASLLVFHILGLYPVPASTQFLIGSPLVSSYTLRNDFLGTSTTVRVDGFDTTSLSTTAPLSSRMYVQSVSIGGSERKSTCWIDFKDLVGGKEVVIVVGATALKSCGEGKESLPDSLSNGGFSSVVSA